MATVSAAEALAVLRVLLEHDDGSAMPAGAFWLPADAAQAEYDEWADGEPAEPDLAGCLPDDFDSAAEYRAALEDGESTLNGWREKRAAWLAAEPPALSESALLDLYLERSRSLAAGNSWTDVKVSSLLALAGMIRDGQLLATGSRNAARTAPECGHPLRPGARPDARYCSNACRQAAHRHARR